MSSSINLDLDALTTAIKDSMKSKLSGDWVFVKSPSYIIITSGGAYYAINGNTGEVEFSGTNGTSLLNQVLTASPENGVIVVKDILVLTSPFTINKPIKLIFLDEIYAPSTGPAIDVQADPVRIIGGKMIVNDPIVAIKAYNNTLIRGVEVEYATGLSTVYDAGILADGVQNVEVLNCKVLNSPAEGIKFRSALGCRAYGNYVENTPEGKAGIICGSNCEKCTIENNVVKDAGGESFGIYLGSHECSIIGNVGFVTSATKRGHILVEGTSDTPVVNAVVADNIIISHYFGIHIKSTYRFTLKGNVVTHYDPATIASGYGIGLMLNNARYGSIVGNTIHDVAEEVIRIFGTSRMLTVVGNMFVNPSLRQSGIAPIMRIDASGGWIRNVDILGNVFLDENGYASAIAVLDAGAQALDVVLIRGNIFYGASGIQKSGTLNNVIIKDNFGYATENRGIATVTGDGSTTTFTVDVQHGLVTDKVAVKVGLDRSGSWKAYLVDTDTDGFKETIRIEVTYDSAPANGETVEIYWEAHAVVS